MIIQPPTAWSPSIKAPAAAPPGNYCCLGLQTAHIGGKVRFTKLTTCVVRYWVPCPYPDVRDCPKMRDTGIPNKNKLVSLMGKMIINLIKTWIFDFGYLEYPAQYITLM
jgi:hypothetical protein